MTRFKFSLICAILFLAHPCDADAGIVLDSGFENPNSASVWTPFGVANLDQAAPGIDSTIEGMETLQLVGRYDGFTFSGVFQDIAVDGTCISVGDQVALSGIMGHTNSDALSGTNTAFLEVAFVDSSNTEFSGSTFMSAGLGSSTPTDVYQNNVTSFATVPSNAVFVRVKSVFSHTSVGDIGTSGSAWVDNLNLIVAVPEPSSGLMFATGLLAIFGRRKRVS